MKKIICVLFGFVMLFGLLSTSAFATSTHAITISNKSDSSLVLEHGSASGVYDLWNEIDSDGTGDALNFHHSFSIDIDAAVVAYNNYLDTLYPNGGHEKYKASKDINNGATFKIETIIWINNTRFSNYAYYHLRPNNLYGHENSSYGKWTISPTQGLSDNFFSMSVDGDKVDFSLNGTVKEIYDILKSQDEYLDDAPLERIGIDVRASCEIQYYNSYGNVSYNPFNFEYIGYDLYDKHIYESASEEGYLPTITTITPMAVKVVPAHEGCYEPVQTEYKWNYKFVNEGYDEIDDKWYGGFEIDETKESNVLTVTGSSGTVFGIAYGTVDSGSKNYITISDILNNSNEYFISGFIDAPTESGGRRMSIVCTVILTFADGKQYKLEITKADFEMMTKLVTPCMHACSACGYCTVTDRTLLCNYDTMWGININCQCEEPVIETVDTEVVENVSVDTENSMVYCEPTVVVEKINLTQSANTQYIKHITQRLISDKTVMAFNIDIFNGDMPYRLNQWGGNEEYLTITIPVGIENAVAIKSGEILVYHIAKNGNPEIVNIDLENGVDVENGTITFKSSSFSPFILAEVPKKTIANVTYNEEDNTCTAEIALTSVDFKKSPVIYIAFYNSNGALAKLKAENPTTLTDKIIIDVPDNAVSCKVMLWTPELTPLCTAYSCDLNMLTKK